MTASTLSDLAADYAAALDWWRAAGVDLDFNDEPRAWGTEPELAVAAPPEPPPRTVPRVAAPALERALARDPPSPLGGDPGRWPADLAGFREFWMTEPSLDPGALADRVAPLGEAGADLLLLTGQPDEGDREALLSGEQGALVGRMLAAMAVDESRVYFASALPRVTPMPDWIELASRGLAALTCHHLRLAAPRRVIIFGKGPSMLAAECGLPMLAAPQLETLARSAAHKRRFWKQWLEWSAPSRS